MGSDRYFDRYFEADQMAKLRVEMTDLKTENARLMDENAVLRMMTGMPDSNARPADVFLPLNSGRARVSHLNSIKIESGYQRCPFSPQRFIVSDPLDWEIDDITVVGPDRVPRSQLSRNQQVPGQWLTAIALSTPWSFDPVDAGHGNVVMTVRYVGHKETDHFVCSVVGRSLEGP